VPYILRHTPSSPPEILMPHTYEVKSGEKHSLFNNDTERPGRKVPRLVLSKDVKTPLQPSPTPNSSSLVLPSVRMSQFPSGPEIKNLYLSPYNREDRMSGWDPCYPQEIEPTEYQHDENPFTFDSAYPAFVPVAYRCSNMSTTPVDSLSRGQLPRCFLSNVQNHPRASRPRRPRLRPASLYPSPLQSSAPPLKPINLSPPPTQPSPSLPLHQPRPSKRIPIISLSRLALACEDLEASQTVSHRNRNETASSNLYFSDFGAPRDLDRHQTRERRTVAELRDDDRLGRVVRCSCGCMESYAIG
jgi:hypothetical protein